MIKYQVTLSRGAERDLDELYESISSDFGEYWARVVMFKIWKSMDRLAISPYGCAEIDGLGGIRRLRAGKYTIIFKIFGRKVLVDHIFYGRSDYLSKLKS